MDTMTSPAARQPKFIDTLTKLSESEWEVETYSSVEGGGTGEEFTINLKKDGDSPGNKWFDNNPEETWIEARFNTPTRIKYLQLKSANDCQERDPYSITISTERPNENCLTHLCSFDKIVFDSRYQVKDFHVDTLEEVSALRITINEVYSDVIYGNKESGTQLAQVILYR